MPPKPKFTRSEVTDAALALVREQGFEKLTARDLGLRLGSSTRPIFTAFASMDEVRETVLQQAKALFDQYMAIAEQYDPAYKMRGMQWVRFAREEPQLFRMLFMQRSGMNMDLNEAVQYVMFGKENDLAIITRDYHATPEQAEQLFTQMWIYTYGLCVLIATGVCDFTQEEIARRLGETFQGAVYVIRSCPAELTGVQPLPSDTEAGRTITEQHPDLQKQPDATDG